MIELHFTVTEAAWLKNPPERWAAGLDRGGLSFRQGLQRTNYPPDNPESSYRRTGTLADKAAYEVDQPSLTLTFGSTFYLPFLVFGTGTFGPSGSPITPVSGKFLSWKATAGPFMGETLTARAVAGYIWAGFKDELLQAMIEGIKTGIREYGSGGESGIA